MSDSVSWPFANLLTLSEGISLQAPLGSLLELIPPVDRVRGRLNGLEDGCLMPRSGWDVGAGTARRAVVCRAAVL